MAGLARVGSSVAFNYYANTSFVRGQFTGANGSVGTIKFKGLATITRTGEGAYTFKLLANDGTSALKGFHLKAFNLNAINPADADGGSGRTIITADALNASGTIDFKTYNQAGVAADVIAVAKLDVEISTEAAS